MTDSVHRFAAPNSDERIARTDERTHEEVGHVAEESFGLATPAGGDENSAFFGDLHHEGHNHDPHIYVIYWPDLGIVKVGITTTQKRWEWWTNRGAVLVAIASTCCTEHARRIESDLLSMLAKVGARPFASKADAEFVLGRHRGGFTECYRLVQSFRRGMTPEHQYDHERAYGLMLPAEFEAAMASYEFAELPIDTAWLAS